MAVTGTQDARSLKRDHHVIPMVARFLLGLVFFVMGLNGFLNFIPPPKGAMPPGAMAFMGALMNSGYMMPLVMGTQFLAGVLLIANRFVPLALALLAPVIVNILAFHVFLQPAGIAPGVVVLVLELYMVWAYRGAFRPMLVAHLASTLDAPLTAK